MLSGDCELKAAVRPGGMNNLWVLPAGALPPNPPELLGGAANRELLASLRDQFDFLVLDSPPVISLADAQVLSSLADGVVLVVSAGTTPRARVQRAEAMLRHVGANVLGVVLNRVQEHQDDYLWSAHYGGYLTAGRDGEAVTPIAAA